VTARDVAARLAELGATVSWVGGPAGGPELGGYPPDMRPAVKTLLPDLQAHRDAVLELLMVGAEGEWCVGCGALVYVGRGVTLDDVRRLCPTPSQCPYRTR